MSAPERPIKGLLPEAAWPRVAKEIAPLAYYLIDWMETGARALAPQRGKDGLHSGSSTSSRAFLTTAASARATIRPSVNCAELLSPVNLGFSRGLTVAARTPRSC